MESRSPSLSLPSSDLAGDKYEYEVFVSFRGQDTRTGLVDCLYRSLADAGIHVFQDGYHLPSEPTLTGLSEAIKQSKVLIPIISRTYASSKPCLVELVQILECKQQTMSPAILPIFYDIEPSDLRHKRDYYFEESFGRHKKNGVDGQTIEEWKQALREIGSITGFVTKKINDGQHLKLIDELIPIVLQKLKQGRLTVPKDLVGVDHHVQEIMRKLSVVHHDGRVIEICGSDVQILGIYGAGGVGKTTVAKVVYNQLSDCFEYCSYLNEIREFGQKDGILSLQNQLISDLLGRSVRFRDSHVAMAALAEQFSNKQVLILLDNVEDIHELDMVVGELSWFGPRSRIIVTSRKSDILSKFKEAQTYEIEQMKVDKALQLFSGKAFRLNSPSKDFQDLSREIVSATRRIPLALEVTGSLLFGKPRDIWVEMLNKLKSTSHDKVMEQDDWLLKMSYDALEENAKPIFLAIACFKIHTWQDDKLDCIEVLIVMSLVKIRENNELLMHDRLRDLGRNILLGISVATIEHVIGIEDRVKELIEFLQIEDDGGKPRMVGICGTDGIGKTTIAKAVYDRLSSCFDSCCFLAEIAETAQNGGGIQCLQTKLICDILEQDGDVASFEGGMKFFLDVFSNIKALIVLDDVEELSHLDDLVGNQLDWFGPGSRIIVTSENGEILERCVSQGRACIYDMNQMDRALELELELFRKHALGTQGSTSDYLEIGERIIQATGEVPLLINVIGLLLHGKTIEDWRKMEDLIKPQMENSQEILKDSREILKICYEALDEKQKQISWDIAWFANGVDSRIALYMWHDFLPSHHVLMPLAKIGEDNILRTHKLLKRLGKTIDQEETKYPGRCSRRYMHVTDLEEINRNERMEEVEALCFDVKNLHLHKFTETNFERMPNIRFLKLDHASMPGNFTNVFPKLRWLRWQGCPRDFEVTKFSLTELVILDLSWSKVTEDWGDWRKFKMEQLKVLNFTGCTDLLISPTFSSFPNLEMLILEGCSRLVHLDPSVGGLTKLLCLNLKSCTELNSLPAELGALKALKELLIDETCVRDISSGSDSKKVEHLTSLSILSADNSKITKLANGVGAKLQHLSLRNCHWIQELPESIGQSGSPLEALDISGTGISELPDSFRFLQRLRVLKMDNCFISKFPSFIWHLDSLEEIHASSCRILNEEIPGDIGKLKNLRILRLRNSAISSLPPEIKHLSKLETLDVLHCDMLRELPELPSGLGIVHLSPKLKEKVSHLSGKHCFITV